MHRHQPAGNQNSGNPIQNENRPAIEAGYVSRHYIADPSAPAQALYRQERAQPPSVQPTVAPARAIPQLTQEQLSSRQEVVEAPKPQKPELPPLLPLMENPQEVPTPLVPVINAAQQVPVPTAAPAQMHTQGFAQTPAQAVHATPPAPQASAQVAQEFPQAHAGHTPQQVQVPQQVAQMPQAPGFQQPAQQAVQQHDQTAILQASQEVNLASAGHLPLQAHQQALHLQQQIAQAPPALAAQQQAFPAQLNAATQQAHTMQASQQAQVAHTPVSPDSLAQPLEAQQVPAPAAASTQTHTQGFAQVPAVQAPQTSSFQQPAQQPAQQQVAPAQQHDQVVQQALVVAQQQQLATIQPHYSEQFLAAIQKIPQEGLTLGQLQHISPPQMQIAPSAYSKYKLPIIPGIAPRTMLPPGVGLVLEGGGTRGFYSAGVFEAFMDAGIMFPYISAVSAGAANVLSYISGQRGRNRLIVERLVSDPRYLSGGNLLRDRSLFNFDFIFKTVPEEYLFFDQKMFDGVQTRLLTGALDCREGRTVWFEKSTLGTDFTPTIASCSIPLVSRMVRFDNRELFDGGILDPIPIEKSVADGNHFHVIVLTQNFGYIKTPSRSGALLKMAYRKYPHLLWALKERHEAYNRQVALAERLEREGRAIIIRPHNTVDVSRLESNPDKLIDLHDEGHLDGALAVDKLQQLFRF